MTTAADNLERVKPGPRPGFRWDETTIAYAIELWHRRTLKTPTASEWRSAGRDHPCRDTVLRVFGSWSAAMRAAGFRARRRGEARDGIRPRRWDEREIVAALTRWHRRHSQTPVLTDWRRAGPGHPCYHTVVRAFGSWSAAVRIAGLDVTPLSAAPRSTGQPRCPRTGRWLPRAAASYFTK